MKILYLASSKTQASQYKEICNKADIDGLIINIKHPGIGSITKSIKWIFKNKKSYHKWLDLEYKKNETRKYKTGPLKKILYIINIIKSLAAVIKTYNNNNLCYLYLRNGENYMQAAIISWAKEKKINIIYTENGQLPNTFVIDTTGVNYKSSVPRDKYFFQNLSIPANYVTKKNLETRKNKVESKDISLPEKYYFVPFQVPTDTQVLLYSPWIKSMHEFYKLLESSIGSLPDSYYFVVKEHPSSSIRYKSLHSKNKKIIFANGNNTQKLIENAVATITLNSSVGIESLILGKPVITLGNAFYNIDDLVTQASSEEKFKKLIEKPEELPYNKDLVSKFIWWLETEYLLPGKLRSFESSEKSIEKYKEKINEILKQKPI